VSRRDPVDRLLAALQSGDDLALSGCLHRDVRLVVDAGDETGCELRGRADVVRELRERLTTRPDASLLASHVNGKPGMVLCGDDHVVVGALAVDAEASGIHALWLSVAPGKLAHWNSRTPDGA